MTAQISRLLTLLIVLTFNHVYSNGNVYINEFHYDNDGSDVNEFIEIAHIGSIAGFTVVRYNGNPSQRLVYTTPAVTSTTTSLPDVDGIQYTVIECGLQNGGNDGLTNSPDGIALVAPNNTVIEFLSYEGNFTAADGPAMGIQSVDIGVFEPSNSLATGSLQRIKGTNIWQGPIPNTKGAANTVPAPPVPVPVATPAPVPSPSSNVTKIHAIQGTGEPITTPFLVNVSAIVTGLFSSSDTLNGFWMQEEDVDADADPNTSEGIFVRCAAKCPVGLAVGSLVDVTGNAGQSATTTQIDATITNGAVTVKSTNNALPTPTLITLPANASTANVTTFQQVEGMLVTFPTTLVVSEYFQLDRFGQIVLTESSVPYTFTQKNPPSVVGLASSNAELAKRRIILDDDNDDSNDAITGTIDEPYFYPTGGLDLSNKFRGGDTIKGLTGVMQHAFSFWRVRPIPQLFNYSFDKINVVPSSPGNVGGTLRVTSFNVLNYFTNLDTGGTGCGPTGAVECRGANSASELNRQTSKIVSALSKMDPDIAGLVELQNSASNAAIAALVNALNAAKGAGTYAFIPTGIIGTDAIVVGLIYKPSTVTPVNSFAILNSTFNPIFVDTLNRPVLTQTFQQISTGGKLTVSVCHFKSKGSTCSGDPDKGDGQGNCPDTRKNAATALAAFLASDPTSSGDTDHLILGDLNAYAQEDAISVLRGANFSDLGATKVGPDVYSYVFDGQRGTLDYALASASLLPQISGVSVWNINADEIPLFDYNDELQTSGESSFERRSAARPIFAPDELRSSDHDPVLIGLQLSGPTKAPTKAPVKAPTKAPTKTPTKTPTKNPTKAPTKTPTKAPTKTPIKAPTTVPVKAPTKAPTTVPIKTPTSAPVKSPTKSPTDSPSTSPSRTPIKAPASVPVVAPIPVPVPVKAPTTAPVKAPTNAPIKAPTIAPVKVPTNAPIKAPTIAPVKAPTTAPVKAPTTAPVKAPTTTPVKAPTKAPVKAPTNAPAKAPTKAPATTEASAVPSRVPTPSPVREPCGLFGLSIFCPFTFCGVFGRLIGLC